MKWTLSYFVNLTVKRQCPVSKPHGLAMWRCIGGTWIRFIYLFTYWTFYNHTDEKITICLQVVAITQISVDTWYVKSRETSRCIVRYRQFFITEFGFNILLSILIIAIREMTGLLFTKRTDVLLQDLVKSRRHEIGCYNDRIALTFDRHLDSAATEVPVEFQSYWESLNLNLAASRLHEILR